MAVLVDTQFTGSVVATGTYRSLAIPVGFVGTASKALLADTASYGLSGSFVQTASYIFNVTASSILGQPLNVLSSSFASNSLQAVWATQSNSSLYADRANYANRVNWPLTDGPRLIALDETNFVTTSRVLPTAIHSGMVYVVNNTVYMVGGYTSATVNTIWTSSYGNPEVVGVATGKILPASRRYAIIRQIGTSLLLFGGYDVNDIATKDIFIANMSSPDTWSVAATMSYPLVGHQMVSLNGGKDLYIFGGASGSAAQAFTMSMYATGSNPLSWSLQPITWTGGGGLQVIVDGCLMVIGDKMYYYGGFSGSYSTNNTLVLTASVSDPTRWGIGANGAPAMGYARDGGVIIGNYFYLFGLGASSTATNTIYRAPINNPTQISASTVGTMSRVSTINNPFIFSGSLYMWSGYYGGNSNTIFKCPIIDYGPTASAVVDLATNISTANDALGRPRALANYYDDNIQHMTASVTAQVSCSRFAADTSYSFVLVPGAGIQPTYVDFDFDLNYNPNDSLLSVPFVSASLMGTASWAITASNVLTASNADTASQALMADTASHAFFAETASYAQTVITQQLDISYSYASSSTYSSASYTSDFAVLSANALTASIVVTASNARTASYAIAANAILIDYIGIQVFS